MLPFFRPLLAFSITFVLSGCGGSDDGISGIDGSGAPVTTAVSGPIDGFGSVIIGGVHYESTNATITVNGQPGTEANLSVGSYVTLQGSVASDGTQGFANSIVFQPNVCGVISSINTTAETLVVLGQTVLINDDTSFDFAFSPRDISALNIGQKVEVSGPTNASGQIVATRIGLAPKAPLEVVGQVSKLNSQLKTFSINQQLVNYGGMQDAPVLADGQRVILRDAEIVGSELKPKKIDIDPGFSAISHMETLVKAGVITKFTSPTDFYVGDVPVTTNDATQYLHTSANALAENVKVSLSGRVVAGKLLAEKIQWLADAQWQIVGPISRIGDLSTSGGRIQVENTWIILNSNTRLDSEFAAGTNRMKFANLHIGDYVVLTGRSHGGEFIAASLEREELIVPEQSQQVLGTARNLSSTQSGFTVFNYKILTNENTVYLHRDQVINAQTFYASGAGQLVSVRGVLEAGKLKATTVKLTSRSTLNTTNTPQR